MRDRFLLRVGQIGTAAVGIAVGALGLVVGAVCCALLIGTPASVVLGGSAAGVASVALPTLILGSLATPAYVLTPLLVIFVSITVVARQRIRHAESAGNGRAAG